MNIEPIAYFRSPLTSKFGIPRQSGIVTELHGTIEFVARYAQPEALRGLEAYDYLWLIWGFSENVEAEKHPTVRPPLLGGNERVGVWATRSPFRPNNLGLSSVRIYRINAEVPSIEVMGADLMDGTPIYDIKPYLPYVDSHPEARGGFTDNHEWQRLQVEIDGRHAALFDAADLQVLKDVLSLDPRPHYHHDDQREYGMPFKGFDIRFRVVDGVLTVFDVMHRGTDPLCSKHTAKTKAIDTVIDWENLPELPESLKRLRGMGHITQEDIVKDDRLAYIMSK